MPRKTVLLRLIKQKSFLKNIDFHRWVLKENGDAERFDENCNTNNYSEDEDDNDGSCRGGCDDESDVGSN